MITLDKILEEEVLEDDGTSEETKPSVRVQADPQKVLNMVKRDLPKSLEVEDISKTEIEITFPSTQARNKFLRDPSYYMLTVTKKN